MISTQKQKSIIALKKAKGTIDKVITMTEEDTYCIDIIQQIDSITGLLKATKNTLLSGHLDHCLAQRITKDKEKTVKELLKVYNLSSK